MNKTVELVNIWGEFESAHPSGNISEFCRFFLASEQEKKEKIKFKRSASPPTAASVLAKMLGRMGRLLNNYSAIALRECGLSSFEEFFYLNDILTNENPKKTEVIDANFNELSSGLLILTRLKKAGLITEKNDKEDKRTKRLMITVKGENALRLCYQKLNKINQVFFADMREEDMQLCSQLLSSTEVKFSTKWIEDKRKSFADLMKES